MALSTGSLLAGRYEITAPVGSVEVRVERSSESLNVAEAERSRNGVGEAARIYFRKDVSNLTLPESALLAGMIQSPNPYHPFRHEKRATERRNEVIRAMRDADDEV